MSDQLRVGIIGLGYVGLTLSIASALRGIKVYGIESNMKTLNSIKIGKAHFHEPYIDELLELCLNKNLIVSSEFDTAVKYDAFILTVGTPVDMGSKNVDYASIKQALNSLSNIYSGDELVILRSTVSVGTTRSVVMPHLAEISGRNLEDLRVAFCPERTVEGKAIEELYSLPQVVGGSCEKASLLANDFFGRITDDIVNVPHLEMAELIKLFNNTYRDVHFAMGNAFNEIAQSFDIDGFQAIEAANINYPRSNIARPGFVGGPCLEKDPYILSQNMPEHQGKDFIINSRKYNESLEDSVVDWVEGNVPSGSTIGLSGLAFKGVPATSDLRGSVGVAIGRKISARGYRLALHDFTARDFELEELALGEVVADFDEFVSSVDVVIVMNNSLEYQALHDSDIKALSGKLVLDVWAVLPIQLCENHGVALRTIGNYKI